jgi:beta-N-acetylhexosaminidase
MQSAGVAATAKHFPGLGPATLNTDFAVVTIAARQETLDAALEPFQAAIDAKVALVMVSSANYPSYGPENPKDPNKPASQVGAIVNGLLRNQMGFTGLVITDDLESIAISELGSTAVAGVKSLAAGCDLILYAKTERGSEDALTDTANAVTKGRLDSNQIQASYDRIQTLKQAVAAASD